MIGFELDCDKRKLTFTVNGKQGKDSTFDGLPGGVTLFPVVSFGGDDAAGCSVRVEPGGGWVTHGGLKATDPPPTVTPIDELVPAELPSQAGWSDEESEKAKQAMADAARSGSRPWLQSKLLVVGEGRAGKTSLIRALAEEDFNADEESTALLETNCCTVERQALQDWHKKQALGGDFARAVAQQMVDVQSAVAAAAEQEERDNSTLFGKMSSMVSGKNLVAEAAKLPPIESVVEEAAPLLPLSMEEIQVGLIVGDGAADGPLESRCHTPTAELSESGSSRGHAAAEAADALWNASLRGGEGPPHPARAQMESEREAAAEEAAGALLSASAAAAAESPVAWDPPSLTFPVALGKPSVQRLRATNSSDQAYTYKVKTTNSKRYTVRPNMGVLGPGQEAEVTMQLPVMKELPTDMQECKDKFQVLMLKLDKEESEELLTKSAELQRAQLTEIWAGTAHGKASVKKIRCSFTLDTSAADEEAEAEAEAAEVAAAAADVGVSKMDVDLLLKYQRDGVEESVTLITYDYGGQRVFYALHHLFLTRFGVYLCCFDMRKMIDTGATEAVVLDGTKTKQRRPVYDPAGCLSFLRFWLASIYEHARDTQGQCATVLLIGTHGDHVKTAEQHKAISIQLLDTFGIVNAANGDGMLIASLEFFDDELCFWPLDNTQVRANCEDGRGAAVPRQSSVGSAAACTESSPSAELPLRVCSVSVASAARICQPPQVARAHQPNRAQRRLRAACAPPLMASLL